MNLGSPDSTAVKDVVSATEFEAMKKYMRAENWPSGIATEAARKTNTDRIKNYKATVITKFEDEYGLGELYILKISPKDNTHMPADLRPQNAFYVVVDEYSLSVE